MISNLLRWLFSKHEHIPVPVYGDIAYYFGHELSENPFDGYSQLWYKWNADWEKASRDTYSRLNKLNK